PEAEPVTGAGRNHQAIERGEHVGLLGDVALETEFDAVTRARGKEVADVALEARLARRDLLEQGRLAGVAKCAARALVLFEHRNLVALGHQRRIGQAGRSGADDGDALAARRPRMGNPRLAAAAGVAPATAARPAAHFVDAGVAGEAAPDRLLAAKLRDPLRIGDEGAAERDEIRLSRRDGLGRDRGIAEAP